MRAASLACLSLLPLSASAELSNESMIGPGLRSRPAYDGSDSHLTEWVPVIRHFGRRWFVRSTQGVLEGGLRAELAPGLRAGAQMAYEPGRMTNQSAFLAAHNTQDIRRSASIGLQMEWDHVFDPVPVTLLARVRQHLDADRGAQADLRLSMGVFRGGPLSAGLFVQATWANAKSTGSLYGITPPQSASFGLPVFAAGAGWLSSSVGLLWSVDLSPHWLVVGNAEARRLRGDAGQSPLAERTTSHYTSVGLTYRY